MSVVYDITTEELERNSFRPLHAGDDYDYTFTLKEDGTAVNLTGGMLWLTIKEDPKQTDASAKLALVSPTQLQFTDAVNGVCVAHFVDTETAELEGLWHYDLKFKNSAGKIKRFARGRIEFEPNLTRAIA